MSIWKLEPVDPKEHHWQASRYDGHVFIRAPDEMGARVVASSAFSIAAQHFGGSESPLHPWFQSATCDRVKNSVFDEEGPDIILGPPEALSRAHPDP